MFSNFLSLTGGFAKTLVDKRTAYGDFSVQRQVKVEVSSGTSKAKRKFLSKDAYTAIGDIKVITTQPVHDPRGYNAEIIAENGDIGPELFATKLRSHGGLSKDVVQEVHANIDAYIWDDSQISLLVALLSTYYVLVAKENKYTTGDVNYEDGHLSFRFQDELCPKPASDKWWSDEDIDVGGWDQVLHTEPDTKNILFTTGLSDVSLSVLMYHLAGRRKTTRFSFDLEMEPLARSVMMTRLPSKRTQDPDDFTSDQIRACLNAYVKLNRLEGAFEAALAIYTQCALRPVPDTAEGMAWLLRGRHLVLPEFRAHRGLYAFMMRDKPFGLSSAVTSTWKLWRDMGLSVAVQGGLFNAVSLWGRYFVEAGYYHDDAEVDRLGSYEFGTAPSAAYYCYAALVTGHDTYCPLPRNIGMGYDPWLEDGHVEFAVDVLDADLAGYDVITRGRDSILRITQVPQPCSTTHVMGRMPEEGYFSTLSTSFTVELARLEQGWEVKNVSQAWGVGLATRWLGYDTEMEYRGVTRIANWASNDTSMAARPFHVKGPDRRSVTINAITPRARVFANLPNLCDDITKWRVTYEVDDTYTVISRSKDRIATRGTFYPQAAKDTNVFVIDYQNLMYTPVTLRVSSRANVRQAGFHVLVPDTSHVPQDPVRPSTDAGAEPDSEMPHLEEGG